MVGDCDGVGDAVVQIFASGVGPFMYRFREEGGTFGPYQSSPMVTLTEMVLYEFQIEDACGNTSAIFPRVVCATPCDTLGLKIDIEVTDAILDCDADTSVMNLGMAIVDTTCCPWVVRITYSDRIVPGVCPVIDTIFRLWIGTEDCVNSDTLIQTIVRQDTTAPQIIYLLIFTIKR